MSKQKLTFLGVEYEHMCGVGLVAAESDITAVCREYGGTGQSEYHLCYWHGPGESKDGFPTLEAAAIAADQAARRELDRMRTEIDRLLKTEPMKENDNA